ncbi:hypothetical protein [Streptomyces sp. NPDC102487]|uniref:hypothetical protein n=1 Tax=Streptomyces sp. NPDC102487 TaxID=3366182 RepID=UPI0037F4BA30
MSETINLDRPGRAFGRLYEQLRWGRSAAHPGLADTLITANDRMEGMLGQLRLLHESRVSELRDSNLAAVDGAGTVRPGEEPTT